MDLWNEILLIWHKIPNKQNKQINLVQSKLFLFGKVLKCHVLVLGSSQSIFSCKRRWKYCVIQWISWLLVVLGFNTTLTAKVISWRSVTHMCFPGFLTPVLTQLFFPKPPTTFFTCFCKGERQKYARKKSRLNQGSNSQPPGHDLERKKRCFENIVGKGDNIGNQYLQCPLSFLICILSWSHISLVVCRYFLFGLVWNFVVWLTYSYTMTPFDAPGKQAFWKHCGKRRNCSYWTISPFSTMFTTRLDNLLPFSSNLKLSSANSFSLEESKICCLVMG